MQTTKPLLPKEREIALAKLVAKSWTDDNFYQRLVREPEVILREAGIVFEDSTEIIVKSDSLAHSKLIGAKAANNAYEIYLPPKPNDLQEELIFGAAAGLSDRPSLFFSFCIFCSLSCSCC